MSENNEEILEILGDTKNGLSVDSLVAVMTLTKEIEINEALIELLKLGKIKAQYKGDKTQVVNPNLFVYSKTKDVQL